MIKLKQFKEYLEKISNSPEQMTELYKEAEGFNEYLLENGINSVADLEGKRLSGDNAVTLRKFLYKHLDFFRDELMSIPFPSPEDIMNISLSDETLKNGLDFVAFLRANEFQIDFNPNEYEYDKWTGAIGGVVGNSIAYMLVYPKIKSPCPWNIWLNEYDFDSDGSADDENLKGFIYDNLNHCRKCNPNWEKCRGGDKTILGRKFEDLCHSPMFFYTPDSCKLNNLKALLLKIKLKKQENHKVS